MRKIINYTLGISVFLLLWSCEDKNGEAIKKIFFENAPIIENGEIIKIDTTSITFKVTINSDGGSTITSRGVCWSENTNPSTTNSKKEEGTGKDSFTSIVNGLNPNTHYYLRAYLTNKIETAYCNEVECITLPIVKAGISSNLTFNSLKLSGIIPTQGDNPIIEYGFCWDTNTDPSIENNVISSTDLVSGNFTAAINGLQSNTQYYAKAYITNSSGTSYSNVFSFKTLKAVLPAVSIGSVSNLSYNTATVDGVINVVGDLPILGYGHCWNTTENPTIENTKNILTTINSSNFYSVLTNLTQNTKYYIRAYVTTSEGTVYSNQTTCTTTTDPYLVSNGLLAFYNFDNQNVNDALGSYNGVKSGGVTFNSSTPNSTGFAAQFNGSTGYINIPFQVLPSTGSWSICFWIKTNKNTIGLIQLGNSWYYPGVQILYNSKIELSYPSYNHVYFNNDISNSLLNNTWAQLAIIYNGSKINYYINGILQESLSATNFKFGNHDFTQIGKWDTKFLSGSMDNIRFYNRAISTTEITRLYDAKQ